MHQITVLGQTWVFGRLKPSQVLALFERPDLKNLKNQLNEVERRARERADRIRKNGLCKGVTKNENSPA